MKNQSSVPLASHAFWDTRTRTITEKHPWRPVSQPEVYKGNLKLLYRFSRQLELLGYHPRTQKTLTFCIEEFLYRAQLHGVTILKNVTRWHIKAYYKYLVQRPNLRNDGTLSSSMVNTHLYALRLFFQYYEQSGEITKNPMSSLSFPTPQSSTREILTTEEISKLYKSSRHLLDIALLGVLYGCGLRASEAINLDRGDVHFKARKLYVREGKGKRRREVPFTEKVRKDLENYYFYQRPKHLKTEGQEAFFVNNKETRIKYQLLWQHFRNLVRSAGIEKQVSPHSLRHSIATHLLESGMSVEYVREFLGHAELETTQLYTRVNSKIVL